MGQGGDQRVRPAQADTIVAETNYGGRWSSVIDTARPERHLCSDSDTRQVGARSHSPRSMKAERCVTSGGSMSLRKSLRRSRPTLYRRKITEPRGCFDMALAALFPAIEAAQGNERQRAYSVDALGVWTLTAKGSIAPPSPRQPRMEASPKTKDLSAVPSAR